MFDWLKKKKKCEYHEDCDHYNGCRTCNGSELASNYCGIARERKRKAEHGYERKGEVV